MMLLKEHEIVEEGRADGDFAKFKCSYCNSIMALVWTTSHYNYTNDTIFSLIPLGYRRSKMIKDKMFKYVFYCCPTCNHCFLRVLADKDYFEEKQFICRHDGFVMASYKIKEEDIKDDNQL